MIYLYAYIIVGVVVLIGVYTHHRLTSKSESKTLSEILDATNPDRKKLHYQILNNYVAPLIAALLMVVAWPSIPILKFMDVRKEKQRKKSQDEAIFRIKLSDLQEALSIEQIEVREIVKDPLGAVPNEPFGHFSRSWKKFVNEVQAFDEIHSFETVWKNEWNQAKKVTGYVILRNHQIGNHFITKSKRLSDVSH